MTLVIIVASMIIVFALGKRASQFSFKQYFLIFLITLLQVGIAVYRMYTMDMPPLR